MEEDKELKQAFADLRRLHNQGQLPPMMDLKLAYMQAILKESPQANELAERILPEERQSIEDISKQSRKQMFISIVRCLSGREIIVYLQGQRTYLKKESRFFPWEKCYLDCDSSSLKLKKKRELTDYLYQMELQKICLSKQFKLYKGKWIFSLYFQHVKYTLGFEVEITCERIHQILSQLINQKKQWSVTKYEKIEEEQPSLALSANKIRDRIKQEQYEYLHMLEQKVSSLDLTSEEGYELIKNINQGRILVGKDGSVKSQVIVQSESILSMVNSFMSLKQWNANVEVFQICNKPRVNCLTVKIKTKKYSMISYPRQASLIVNYFRPCVCAKQIPPKHYLILESLPDDDSPTEGSVRMNYKQIVQFTPNKENNNLILISILTKIKFNGYCSQADNIAMTLHLMESLDKFSLFVKQPEKTHKYFQMTECPCGGTGQIDFMSDVSLPTQRDSLNQPFEEVNNRDSQSNPNGFIEKMSDKKIISAMQDLLSCVVNEDILQVMNKNYHYRYYLKHKFLQIDESFDINEGEEKNFFKIGTRWKMENEQIKYIDKVVLAAQKDILKMVLKQISANIMAGKSIMNMSLPVQIMFEKSILDLIADSYGFFPPYAARIAKQTNPVQQIKLISCAFLFQNATRPNIEKPFNPILGQTYQGMIGDIMICIEQVSHHPAVSAVYLKTKQFEIYGNVELIVEMGVNSVYSRINHWLNVKVLTTNTQYIIKSPDIQLGGLIFGDRTFKVINKGCVFEKKNNLYLEFTVGKEKKRVYESKVKVKNTDIIGGVFKIKKQLAAKLNQYPKTKTFQGIKAEDVMETYSIMSGKWYGDILFDGVSYKSFKQGPFPLRSKKLKYVLPSDSIWREDVIHKIWKNNQKSNRQKERLQNIQRNDRKLREKYSKSH